MLYSLVYRDMDKQGKLDFLIITEHNDIYKFTSNAKYFKNTIFWSQHDGNKEHTNSYLYSQIRTNKYIIIVSLMALIIISIFILFGWKIWHREKWVNNYN